MTGDNAVHIKLATDGTPTLYDQHGNDLGSVGGSSLVQVALVVLDNDQIKALPTTAVTLVAAPGTGKVLRFLAASAVARFSSGAYATVTVGSGVGDSMQLSISSVSGTGSVSVAAIYSEWYSGVFTFAGDQIIDFVPRQAIDSGVPLSIETLLAPHENGALKLVVAGNGGSNFTGGNAANTLTVATYYVVLDL